MKDMIGITDIFASVDSLYYDISMTKKVIIVWASSWIGKQLTVDMAKKWYQIGIIGRREELLEDIQKKYPHNIHTECLDIADEISCIAGLEKLREKLWGMDILILSAGVGYENSDLIFEKEHDTIKVNIVGRTRIATYCMSYFLQQNSWIFIPITSISALRGMWGCPSYNASKAYQSNYIESLRLLADKKKANIHILEVQPWYIDTKMAQWNLFWVCPLPKASQQILNAIQKKKKHIYLSKRRRIIAWIMKILPYSIYSKITNSL